MPHAQAEALKAQGNQFFKSKQYEAAIAKYQEACKIDPNVPAYFSNTAACFEKLGKYREMAQAGQDCIRANKKFLKGYFRLATAQKALGEYPACVKTIESGLAVDSTSPDLKRMRTEVNELLRGEQVNSFCNKAEEQMMSGDIPGAMKSLDLASRLDAGNPIIERMMSKVKPKFEAMEKRRKANLSATEVFKERGDEAYKAANFEVAIGFYTQCIDALKREGKETNGLAIKAYSNRSACYKQISNFDGTIEDCSMVLEVEPENIKALIGRAQAFEGVERYRFALQDVKTVLGMPYAKVGKSNFDLCNGMQHRLNRTVQQLKRMS